MSTVRARATAILVACLCTVVAVGCGSDASGPTPAPTGTVEPTPAPTTTATPEPSSAPTPSPAVVLWIAGCGAPTDPGCGCSRNFEYCDEGVLARSEDLGNTWTRMFFDTGLGSIDFPSRTNGWAVGAGGVVFRTTDGGETWVRKTDGIELPASSTARGIYAFNSIRFLDERHGVIAGFGFSDEVIGQFGPITLYRQALFVLFTEDGGESWAPAPIQGSVTTSSGGGVYASAMCFTDKGSGVIAGSPSLLTRDGGRSWENINDRLSHGAWGAACLGDGTMWLALAERDVVRSDDDGQTWTVVNDPNGLRTNCCYAQLDFLSRDAGWRSGEELVRTNDGGATWNAVDAAIPAGFGASAVRFATPEDGLWTSTGIGGVTHDGGATWERLTIVPYREGLFGLADIAVQKSSAGAPASADR